MIIIQKLIDVYPIFSLLFSLILFIGLYQIGEVIFYNDKIKLIISSISEIKYQKILVAANFLMIIIFPIVLFASHSKQILSFFSILIFLLGLLKIIFFLKKKFIFKNNFKYQDVDYYISILIILGIFLIAFGPVNHIDSLDYHMWGAKYIFQTGRLPTTIESFTNLLVSSGEALYSLGFFFGAEQFGNLIQFSGIISLIGIFKKFNKNKYFFLLLILSSPMILFLVTSPKPQFLHLCSNAFLFVLLFINFNYLKSSKFNSFELIVITNVFLINSINTKFSFILSSSILYFLLVIIAYKKNYFIKMVFINSSFLCIFYLGFAYWKYLTWGGNFFYYFVNPIPIHLDGGKLFYDYLINYNNISKGGEDFLNLFIPRKLGQYSEAIGIGILIFIYFFSQKKKIILYFIPIFLFFILVNYFYGQASSRFYFELYIWMILLLASIDSLKISTKYKFIFYPQFLLSICATWVGVFVMSYGFITADLRDYVMKNTAHGYSLFKWSNNIFKNKKDTVVLAMHRSTALGKGNVYATSFQNFLIFPGHKVQDYHIEKYLTDLSGSTYVLTTGSEDNVGIFTNCIDYLYKSKKNVGRIVGRNPFNKGGYYDGYLLKLKDLKESNCLK
jgi:hypothetical protein